MNLTLDYVKKRLLNAGASLQHVIVDPSLLPQSKVYVDVHYAQNQLALGLATLVQIEHDSIVTAATPQPPTPSVREQHGQTGRPERFPGMAKLMQPADIAEALRREANAKHPDRTTGMKYVGRERDQLLAAAAVIESLHPSLLDS